MLETERLILRPWKKSDTEDLFRYTSDSDIEPIAEWPPHQSIDETWQRLGSGRGFLAKGKEKI